MNANGFAIQLYFDRQTENRIRAFRESLYQTGIQPVLGKKNDRPHVTLAVLGMEDAQRLIRIGEEFSRTLRQFRVELVASGVFPTSDNVIYLTPVPSLRLIDTHHEFHRILSKEGLIPSHYYLPDRWVPHCTLETEQTDEQFEKMVLRCKRSFTSIDGFFSSLGVISFWPIDYLAEFPLISQDKK